MKGQLTFPGFPTPPVAAPLWEGTGGPLGRDSVWWQLNTSGNRTGYAVRHCGHPTALTPYYVTNDAGPVEIPGGPLRTFRNLKAAQQAVEGLTQ